MPPDTIHLQNNTISVDVTPALGGKVVSLKNRNNDYEWLWKNPYLTHRPAVDGESYIENLDSGGWDEIFPSISPLTTAEGIQIPDHGELVFLTPEVLTQTESTLSLRWTTHRYHFTRTLKLNGSKLLISYQLESLLGQESIPYLWAAHPLINLEQDMCLEIPCDPTSILYADPNEAPLPFSSKTPHHWELQINDPESATATLNSELTLASKFFCPNINHCRLRSPHGGTMTIEWDSKTLPYLGVWLNQRAWSGCGSPPYFNLGLEPTTSPQDSLLDAIEYKQHRILQPGKCHNWSLAISLNS